MSGKKLRATWNFPSNTGGIGVAIDAYRIKFRQKDGIFKEIIDECDGTKPTIISTRYCDVEMTTFLASTFNLVEGDHIGVIVEALNVIDYSVPSIVNSVGEKA
jgi:hypothetical protein